jgi:cbb3-type cytochrome oxidase subunit 3
VTRLEAISIRKKRNEGDELTIYHVLLIFAFVGIVLWAFGRKRKARFEKDASSQLSVNFPAATKATPPKLTESA